MVRTFYCYPSKAKHKILYSHSANFDLLLFKALRNKVAKRNSWKTRIRTNWVLDSFLKLFFKVRINLPDDAIRLIYDNGEKRVCFKFVNDVPEIVYHISKKGEVTQEKFKGYPIIPEYKSESLNFDLINKTLSNHWLEIKKKSNKNVTCDCLHGDLTHFNILCNKNDVSLIDSKKVTNSILFDHFYFYAYLSESLEINQSVPKDVFYKITKILNNIYGEIFCNEDKMFLFRALRAIDLEDATGLLSKTKYYDIFCSLFIA